MKTNVLALMAAILGTDVTTRIPKHRIKTQPNKKMKFTSEEQEKLESLEPGSKEKAEYLKELKAKYY